MTDQQTKPKPDHRQANKAAFDICVVTDGRAGIENQALGLAEAIQVAADRPVSIKRLHVEHRTAFSARMHEWLGSYASSPAALSNHDLWIGCGRAALPQAFALAKRTAPRPFLIQLQNPRRNLDIFDLVIPPQHDGLNGENILSSLGALNRITTEKLIAAKKQWRSRLIQPRKPLFALLIGGNSKRHKMDQDSLTKIDQSISAALAKGYAVYATASRRSPQSLRQYLQERSRKAEAFNFWDESTDNPYLGLLACADQIGVTQDSVNMLTEACATGKPVSLLPVSGRDGKLKLFYQMLKEQCHVHAFDGQFQARPYLPLQETQRIANIIWQKLAGTSTSLLKQSDRS